MNRYFDTHTHYNDPRFAGDLQEVLQGIRAVNVMGTAVIGYDLSSSIRGLQLAGGSLPLVAGEIARIKNISVEEVCRKTWENACKLYRIPEEA